MSKKEKTTKAADSECFQEKWEPVFRPETRKTKDLERLRVRCPGVYSDFIAGRIGSLRAALKLVELRPERTRVQKLKNSWKKASPKERQEFATWLTLAGDIALPTQGSHSAFSNAPIANGRYLLPQTISRMEAIMTAQGMTPADVMQDMGFGANDRTLLRAMARKTCLRLKVIEALARWLRSHEADALTL